MNASPSPVRTRPQILQGPVEVGSKTLPSGRKRAAESLREEIDLLGPVRLKEVEAAQDAIIQVVRRLEEEGTITLESQGADSLVA